MIKYVSAYITTRHYGGPEEGGWWYNLSHLIETLPFEEDQASEEVLKEHLRKKHEDKGGGDIYSVLGGALLEVLVEDEPGQYQDTEVPRYE